MRDLLTKLYELERRRKKPDEYKHQWSVIEREQRQRDKP